VVRGKCTKKVPQKKGGGKSVLRVVKRGIRTIRNSPKKKKSLNPNRTILERKDLSQTKLGGERKGESANGVEVKGVTWTPVEYVEEKVLTFQ